MKPTTEQEEAVARFRDGGALKINAFAGTGKTTTLQLIAASTKQKGMYLAFNKAIAVEAQQKFPDNVFCSTLHSLAFRATPREFRHGDKMTGSLNANAFAQHLGYKEKFFGAAKLTARQQGHLAKETLRNYLQGGRQNIEELHIPNIEDIGNLGALDPGSVATIKGQAFEGARSIWSRMSDPADNLPLGHDGYLKLWALSRPQLAADFVLLDEAQDTNPVVLGVLARQNAQIVYVGDRHQQIYEWRGAVNAMELAPAKHSTYLTTSFRFGEAIAGAASSVLRKLNEGRPLTGNPGRTSYLGADACEAILARTNASVMSVVLDELEAGRRPHVVGGTGELMRMLDGVRDLKQGRPSDVSEFFGFSNWKDVVEFTKEPAGEQLRTFVKLVETHGEDRLIRNLKQTSDDEAEADVVVSTAHKAKGREWDTVELTDDFLPSRPDPVTEQPKVDPSELRLFYVALTRAKVAVELSSNMLDQFAVKMGERYANPKREQLKRTAAPIVPRVHAPSVVSGVTPSANLSQTPSRTDHAQSSVGSGGVTVPWWLIIIGLIVLVAVLRS